MVLEGDNGEHTCASYSNHKKKSTAVRWQRVRALAVSWLGCAWEGLGFELLLNHGFATMINRSQDVKLLSSERAPKRQKYIIVLLWTL
jgi:hypothetical protein